MLAAGLRYNARRQAHRGHSLKNIAMTMLTTIPTSTTRPFIWRTAIWLARSRRLANRFLAAIIARHERHATRVAIHRLDDRLLKDISDGALADRQPDRGTGADAGEDAAAGVALRGVGLWRPLLQASPS